MPREQSGLSIFPSFAIAGGVTAADSDTYNPGPSALGFDGTNYIVVSCRTLGPSPGLFGVVVTGEGVVLRNFPISRQTCPVQTAIAFDGINYLLAFEQNGEIDGIRFSPSGKVLDGPAGFVIASAGPTDTSFEPAVAFDGANYLVVWFEDIDRLANIYGAMVTTGGKVSAKKPISPGPEEQGSPSVVFDGVNYMVVWSQNFSTASKIVGTRVTAGGAILDPAPLLISTGTSGKGNPHVIFDGTNYFVVWLDVGTGTFGNINIYGARMRPDGVLLDGPPNSGAIPISISTATPPGSTPPFKDHPWAAFDGTNYFVTWDEIGGIFAARVSRKGLLLDPPADSGEIPIVAAPCFASCLPVFPEVLFKGDTGFMTWLYNNEFSGEGKDLLGDKIVSPPFFISAVPSPVLVGGSFTATGNGFTAGSVLNFFVATATGPINAGPLKPSAIDPNHLKVSVPASITQGEGFVAIQAVNTDHKFAASPLVGSLLQGSAAAGLPSITTINGSGIAADSTDPGIGLANVETVVPQGSTVTLGGSGFDLSHGVAVDVFCDCPLGKVGPFFINRGNPGLTAGSIIFALPAVGQDTPATGPGSFRVSNAGADGRYGNKSNSVSAPIGQTIVIISVIQSGSLITVNGGGFSSLTVINFFNFKGGKVVNLGGLNAAGAAKIPLTITSGSDFSFTVPAGAVPGPAYVEALNPPFVPFTSTANDIGGGFTLH